MWANHSRYSLQKSGREQIAINFYKKERRPVIRSGFEWITVIKLAICSKNCIFHIFWQFSTGFPLYYAQEGMAQFTLCWFLKSDGSDSLSTLFKKSDREQFAQVTHDKIATGAIGSFSQTNWSFAHKKRVIRSKNQWVNSQPWKDRRSGLFKFQFLKSHRP